VSIDVAALLDQLAANDPQVAAAAARALAASIPLTGRPPAQLLAAIALPAGLPAEPVLDLARAWQRPDMSGAALDELRDSTDSAIRERFAWLLKTVLAQEHASRAIAVLLDQSEAAQVRRWLLEGIERLVFSQSLGWSQLADVVTMLASAEAPVLRAGLAGLLSALPWRARSQQILESLLSDADAEVVAAAGHTLAGHPDAVRSLPSGVLENLRTHTNPLVRYVAAELDAAMTGN
jgi:hypothetical protein